MFSRIRLQHFFFLGFTVIAAVPVLILSVWVQESALERELSSVADKHLLLARHITGVLARYTFDVQSGFKFTLSNLKSEAPDPALPILLKALGLRHVCLAEEKGKIIATTLNFGGNLSEKDQTRGKSMAENLFRRLESVRKRALAHSGEVVFSGVMHNHEGRPSIYLVQALPGGGFGIGEMDTAYMVEVQKAIAFGRGGYAAIVDQFGRAIAHPREDWQAEMKDLSALKPVQQMLAGRTGVVEFYSPAVKARMITGYTIVPTIGWGVMIPQPYQEMVERTEQIRNVTIGIALFGLLIAALIGWLLSRLLTGPIRAVARSASDFAAGRGHSRVLNTNAWMPLEMRELTEAFNRMADEVDTKSEELIQTAIRLTDAQRIAKMGNWEWDLENNRIWWSEGLYQILEFAHRDLIQDASVYASLVHPDDAEMANNTFREAVRTGENFEIEHRMVLPSGRELLVNLVAEVNKKGNPEKVFLSGTLQDITERRQAEKALEEEGRFRRLVGHAADAFFIIDLEGRVLDANQTALEMLGYTQQEFLSLHVDDFARAEQFPDISKSLRRLEPGHPITVLAHHQRKDGSRFPVEVNLCSIESEGKLHFLAVARDITERRQLEEQLQQSRKMEAIGRLAGGVAHDFNNILVPILGFTELVMENLGPENENYQDLNAVHLSALRARELVAQILQVFRKTEVIPATIHLPGQVAETIKLLNSTLPKNIKIISKIHPEPAFIMAEESQVQQVILNLCLNAGQAMPEGGELTVEVAPVELERVVCFTGGTLNGRFVRLRVSDQGEGMDQDTINRIFDPFFTTKPVGEGTGLGLSTVLNVVNNSGGGICVFSHLGEGTTFEIYFKLANPPGPTAAAEQGPALRRKGASILLVDDEKPVTDLMLKILSKNGFRLTAVNDSEEALAIFQANPKGFDLVITDQMMPKLTGEKLIDAIRKIRPDIPVIIGTGFSETLSQEKVQALGAVRFYAKPIRAREFLEMVDETL